MTPPATDPAAEPAAEIDLVRLDDAHRYELRRDGTTIAYATFHRDGDVVTIPHTEVDPTLRGNGIGAILVERVLDDLRRNGDRLVPACWYVAGYVRDHPDTHDLLA